MSDKASTLDNLENISSHYHCKNNLGGQYSDETGAVIPEVNFDYWVDFPNGGLN